MMKLSAPAAVALFLNLYFLTGRIHAFKACGNELSDQRGTITSPRYPTNYPSDANCSWTITAPPNEIIDIRFSKLDLDGYTDSCPDVVTVFDGAGPQDAPITRLCRYKEPDELQGLHIRSTSNKIHITFTSDSYNTRQGFLATYWTHACPPLTYGVDTCSLTCNCVASNTIACDNVDGTCLCKEGWTGADCSLDVDECANTVVEPCPSYQDCFNTAGGFTCECKEGLVETADGICQVNASSKCPPKSCSHLCVKLLSGNDTQVCYCPDNTQLNDTKCSACPGLTYGKNCEKTCDCDSRHGKCNTVTGGCTCNKGWTSPNCSVDVDECALSRDLLICKTQPHQFCVNTVGSYRCDCDKGFLKSTKNTCEPRACNITVNAATPGTIETFYSPNTYWPNAFCTWTLSGMVPNKISLQVLSLPYENFNFTGVCLSDYVEVYDGQNSSSHLLGRYCQDKLVLGTIRSTGNSMHVVFRSDRLIEKGYLRAKYTAYNYPACKQDLTVLNERQIIQSPQYPGYENNTFCYWLIRGGIGNIISLRINIINVDRSKSFLAVYDGQHAGDRLLGQYFGTSIPNLIRSTGNLMYIVFQSEGTITGTGFNGTIHAQDCPSFFYGQDECTNPCICNVTNTAECNNIDGACFCFSGWTSTDCSVDINECENPNICRRTEKCINTPGSYRCVSDCNKVFSGRTGNIETIDYPDYILDLATCNFTITAMPQEVVTFKIEKGDFMLLETANCNLDWLEIYNNQVTQENIIGRYCGTRLPNIIRTTDSTMNLNLITTLAAVGMTRKGFRGRYYTHTCPAFKWGVTCDYPCDCDKLNTEFCDNTNGICVCNSRWMGADCSEDVNECRFSRCSENEICQNTPGSFTCICKEGFNRDTAGHCTGVRAACTTKVKASCSHSCYKNSLTGLDTCSCPDELELGHTSFTQFTCVIPYYPYGNTAHDSDLSPTSTYVTKVGYAYVNRNPIPFSSGVPFGDSLRTEAYVYSNGIIGFDKFDWTEEPNLQEANDNKQDLIAAFWAKVNPLNGETFYHLYEKCQPSVFNEPGQGKNSPFKDQVMDRAANDVKQLVGVHDFDVQTVLVVTWKGLTSYERTDNLVNTFQAIYISGYRKDRSTDENFSDEETAYIYFIYQKGQMQWLNKNGRKMEVGFVASPYTSAKTITITENSFNLKEANYLESLMLEVSRRTSPTQKCQNHVCKNSRLINNFPYRKEIQQLYNCPCALGQLGLQWSLFEKRGQDIYCFAISPVAKRRLLQSNPRNKLCCYRWSQPALDSDWKVWAQAIAVSSFIHKTSDAGHILVGDREWYRGVQENIDAHQWCCKDSQSSKLCSRFNLIYPDFQCSNNVTFGHGHMLGDPHINTFDNLTYTMNGEGEFTLMDIQSFNFTLQARTSRILSNQRVLTNATVFTAFAARERDYARFQVMISSNKKTMVIFLDGVNITSDFYLAGTFKKSLEYIELSRDSRFNKTKVVALFPCGVAIEVNVGVNGLELNLEVDKELRDKTRGLLGNFNGRPNDDFLLPNGTVLPANMTEKDIYRNFATQYLVSAVTSVFFYAKGQSAADFYHPEFIPVTRDTLNPNASLLKTATDLCGGQELCIYDFLVTGDETFANNTKMTWEFSIASRNVLENIIPRVEVVQSSGTFVNNRWFVQEGVVNTLRFTATDEDGDFLTYLLDGSPRDVSINQSGILTYSPNTLDPVNIAVRVKDLKNGYSPWLYVSTLICPQCNNNGTCQSTNTPRKIENFSGQVQILKCTCLDAFIGDKCEAEKDACKSKPCAKGQNCTDLTAAQQGNNPTGYVCGPCPTGFENVEKRCTDKDECNGTNVCDHICTNTEGSFICSCEIGYILSPLDSRTCFAKNCSNRCVSENTEFCNEPLSQCVCKAGITSNDCSVLDSCLSNPCPNNLLCQRKANGYECLCRNGLPVDAVNVCRDCNRTLTATSGKLMSTNYPSNYPDESYCTWTIVSEEVNAIITLNITDFEMEGCPFDYLEVYDGLNTHANLIGQYCEEVPKTIVSSGNALHVVFTSDASVNLRGFIASYVAETQCRIKQCTHTCQVVHTNPRVETCICPPWTRLDPLNDTRCLEINVCNSTVEENSGYIVSPSYPQKYQANITCSWYIPASHYAPITLRFSDIDMESGTACSYDSVTVYSGNSVHGPLLGKFCGSALPQDVIASAGTGMYIVFKSDPTISGRGFKALISKQFSASAFY